MKKIFRMLFVPALAAAALISCQRENDLSVGEGQTVHFVATSDATRTAFADKATDGSYPVLWTANDSKVKVSLNGGSPVDATVTAATDGTSADFAATLKTDGVEAPYTFTLLSPATAYLSNSPESKSWQVQILSDQVPGDGTPDENAQVLSAVSAACTSLDETISVNFSHVTAYGRMTLSNLSLTNARVTGVSLTAKQPLTGRFFYHYAATDEYQAGEVEANTTSNTLNIATNDVSDIWFACAPADLSGTDLKVTVNTTDGPIVQTVKVPAGRKLESGRIARFTVDMTGATQAESKVYELVTDPSRLTAGAEVIIANAAGDYAISTTQNTNNRAATAVTVKDGKIVDPSESVEILTIAAGYQAGTVAFKTHDGKYLSAAGGTSNNYLRSIESVNNTSSFKVTIDAEGVATAAAAIEGRNTLRYNPNGGSPIFNCYVSTSTTGTLVAIYRLVKEGEGEDDPIFQATLEGASTSGVLEVEAATTSATLSVVANVDWEISSSSSAVSFDPASGNGSATVAISFPANETDAVVSYTFNIESDLGEYEFTINQAAKAVVPEGDTATFDFTTMGLENGVQYPDPFTSGNYSVTFTGGGNNGKYYDTGTGIRTYGDGSIVVAGPGIIGIEYTFANTSGNYPSNDYTISTGTFTAGVVSTWTGSANEVTLTRNSGSGHWRLQKVVVTYDADAPVVVETVATPTFNPGAGAVAAGTVVTISCATAGADIYYTVDGSTPTTASTKGNSVTINAATTVKAIAVKSGMNNSEVATAAYTVSAGGSGKTVSVNIGTYASEHSWENGTKYESVAIDENITATVAGGGNTGKFYTNGNDWRLYQTESATLTISASAGNTIETVKVTYTSTNNGVLKNGSANVSSDAVVSVSASSITFTVGNTGSASNGQVRVTAIEVTYN